MVFYSNYYNFIVLTLTQIIAASMTISPPVISCCCFVVPAECHSSLTITFVCGKKIEDFA